MVDTKEKIIESDLVDNFKSIQDKINKLNEIENMNIKQISDLARYIDMQKTIIDSILVAKAIDSV